MRGLASAVAVSIAIGGCGAGARAPAARRAVWIQTPGECFEHTCDRQSVVVRGDGRVVRIPDAPDTVVVDPDGRFAYFDTVGPELDLAGRPRGAPIGRAFLARIDLETGAVDEVAACTSPALSPGGAWLLCRDQRGDVFRTSLRGLGGVARPAWEPVYREDEVELAGFPAHAPYLWNPPAPVSFPGARTIRVETGGHVAELAWRE